MRDAFVKPLVDWYAVSKRDLPWRHTRDPYAIWVSEIMLQQTRVEAVKGYYERFLEALPNVEALAACPDEKLLKLWEGLGYYSRVRNMKRAAETIVAGGGSFPNTREGLLALPGIGPYTAGAISSIAFGLPEAAVDGNVLRVLARLEACEENILSGSLKRRMEKELREVTENAVAGGEVSAGDFAQSLIELGALICVPNAAPRCAMCPVADECEAGKRGLTDRIPLRIKETSRRVEELTVFLVRDGDSIAIRRREGEGLLGGMYEFPNLPGHLDRGAAVEYIEKQGFFALNMKKLPPARHLFSHVEWRMTAYEVRIASFENENENEYRSHDDGGEWLFAENSEIEEKYALPSAFSAYARRLRLHLGKDKG